MRTLEELTKAVNIRDTMRMFSIVAGCEMEFLKAHLWKEGEGWTYPNLHDDFLRRYEQEAMKICGAWWGYNPANPAHPMNKFFMNNYKKDKA